MRNRKLNQKEVSAINLFVSNVTDIDIVEGIYLVPYIEKSNKQGVRIITIYNTDSDYLHELNGNDSALTGIDYNSLHTMIMNYNGFFQNTTGLSFFANSSENYRCSEFLTHSKRLSLQSLVSGTILFDRLGNIEKNRFKALNQVKPFKEAVLLRNIDDVLPKDEAIQYQKKANI